MRFAFTDDQILFRDTVRDLLDKECPPEQVRFTWARRRRAPAKGVWAALAEMGVLGMQVPEAHGGHGPDRGRPGPAAGGDRPLRPARSDRRDGGGRRAVAGGRSPRSMRPAPVRRPDLAGAGFPAIAGGRRRWSPSPATASRSSPTGPTPTCLLVARPGPAAGRARRAGHGRRPAVGRRLTPPGHRSAGRPTRPCWSGDGPGRPRAVAPGGGPGRAGHRGPTARPGRPAARHDRRST